MTNKARALEHTAVACLVLAVGSSTGAMLFGPSWSAVATKIPVALGLMFWLLAASLRKRVAIPQGPLLLAAGVFAVAVIGSSWSSDHATSWRSATNVLVPTLGFVMACGLLTSRGRRNFFLASLAALAGLLGAYGLLQVAGVHWTPRTSGSQALWISSIFFHYSHWSGFLALALPAALGLALFATGKGVRSVAAGVALLLGFNLALTLSWDVMAVTGGVSLVLLGWWASRVRRRRNCCVAIVSLLVIVVASLTVLFVAEHSPDRLAYMRSVPQLSSHLAARLEGRMALYRSVAAMIRSRPWLGTGPGTFAAAYTLHRPADSERHPYLLRRVNHAHNDLLQIAGEAGVPAAVAFGAFWLLVIVLPAQGVGFASNIAVRSGLISLVVSGCLDANLTVVPPTGLLAWVLAGLLHAPRDPATDLVGET